MVSLARVSPAPDTAQAALDELLAPVLKALAEQRPDEDVALVIEAGRTAAVAHATQVRRSGEPYVTHPVAVATIVAQLGLDAPTVAAALLHDAVEDTNVTLEAIDKQFGPTVARVVDGVTKLDRLQFDSKEAQQAATIRKMLIAMANDWRVLLIKLADRLHNMQTLAVMPEWKQRRTAQETLDVYAPLAHRLGIEQVKWQLEDLAFATLYPKRYAEIEQMVATRAPQREDLLARVLVAVREQLEAVGLAAEVTGRPKHLWSIYEKMVVRGREFDDIHDLVGIRVVVGSEKDCWGGLGAIHAIWPPVQGRFKDYINTPKFNLYQSLHTTVIGLDGKPVEVQVRTEEMHRRAEYGIAAHWGYKEQGDSAGEIAWMQRIADVDQETNDPVEFLAALKLDLEQDEVYVFTPKGRVIALPAQSNPVDFAYAIHTEVGHRCIGARVNGRLVPLETKLTSADTVEIFTSKSPSAAPSRDWLQIVASSRARNKIRQWFSRERREDAIENGREELTKAVRRAGMPLHKVLGSAALERGGRVHEPCRPRRAVCRHRRAPGVPAVGHAAPRPRAARRRGGATADHGLARGAPDPLVAPHGRRCLRRGPRRRDGPSGPVLHPGARRRDRRVRDPGPWGLGAPLGLLERHGARPALRGAPDRGRVGPGERRRVPGDPGGPGLRSLETAGRCQPGGVRAPPEHRGGADHHHARPGESHGLRRRAGRPGPPAVAGELAQVPRRRLRRLPAAPGQASVSASSAPTGTPRAPRGTHDVLWPESARWEAFVATFACLVQSAGYGLVETPVFEDAAVFRRGIGEASDVVGKEMYEFEDRDGTMLALRPEGTAPVVRAYLQHRPVLPWKSWYLTAAFRHERPQAGRYRQHHQVGIEALGEADPDLDVEVIWVADRFFRTLGLADYTLSINSMGDGRCRPAYIALLAAYLHAHADELCEDHRARIDANPMRVLDCKRPECRAATEAVPRLVDHLCEDCRPHFARVRDGLQAIGIKAQLDHRLVRGFDYYTRTTFEFASAAMEAAQNGIGGGGRYDGLAEAMGGPPTPGIGFGIGIERVLLACDAEECFPVTPPTLDAWLIDLVDGTTARDLSVELREAGLRVDRGFGERSLKAHLRAADRSGALAAVIVGAEEQASGTVALRPLRGGEQRPVSRAELAEALRALREDS